MNVTEKTRVFLPVHPKCKSLKPEILSVSYNFRELRLENSTANVLTHAGYARELGEGGLTQVAVDAKEETTGRAQEKVFSRTILHFGAASYSLCDEQENASGISIDYFCVYLNSQQQRRHLAGGFTCNAGKALSWAFRKSPSFSSTIGGEGTPHILLCVTLQKTNINQNKDYTPH